MQSSKIDRIKYLVEQLNAASESYYAKDREIMSNYEYDKLYDELVELEKETGVTLAVDRLAARGNEDRPLVGREGVVGDDEVRRGRGEHALAGSRGGVAVTDDVVRFERGVVFAVGHRADAAHRFVQPPQPGDFGVFVLGADAARQERRCGY